jgi:hypothetical protein
MKSPQKKQQGQKPKRQRKVLDNDLQQAAQGILSTDFSSAFDSSFTAMANASATNSTVSSSILYGIVPNTQYSNITTGIGVSPHNYTISSGGAYSNNTTTTNVHLDAAGLTMKEGADIVIGGKSLTKAIAKIEERLGILNPNPALEDRWEQLKELRRQYVDMEKDLLEKEKIMKILKG